MIEIEIKGPHNTQLAELVQLLKDKVKDLNYNVECQRSFFEQNNLVKVYRLTPIL